MRAVGPRTADALVPMASSMDSVVHASIESEPVSMKIAKADPVFRFICVSSSYIQWREHISGRRSCDCGPGVTAVFQFPAHRFSRRTALLQLFCCRRSRVKNELADPGTSVCVDDSCFAGGLHVACGRDS